MNQVSGRVLVVDDDPKVRRVMVRILESVGYEGLVAESATQADVLLEAEVIDLIILDVAMPVKSGMQYLPEVKNKHPDVAVIMLTGEHLLSQAVKAMSDGALDYVTKPAETADLISRIERARALQARALESKTYQRKLEDIVDDLNGRLNERDRQLSALTSLHQLNASQEQTVVRAYDQFRDAVGSLSSAVEILVGTTRVGS